MADEVLIPIRGDERGLKNALDDSEKTVNAFGANIKRIFLAIGAAIAAKKIFDIGKGFVESFSEAQDAEQRLEQQLKMTGEAAQQSKEQILARSNALMAMSKEDDDAITSLQALLLTFRNISGDEFERATKVALDLSAALGDDLSTAGEKVARALNAPDVAFRMLRESGIAFTDAQEKAVKAMVEAGDVAGAQRMILDELEASFGGAAAAAAGTFSGQVAQLKNRFGNLGEEIGARLIPILEKLFPVLEAVANFTANVIIPAIDSTITIIGEWGNAIFRFLKPAFDFILKAGLYTFTTIQTVIQGFVDVSLMAIYGFALGVVKAFENIRHLLTRVIPEYLSWFARNWRNILTDIVNATKLMVQNIGTNFTNLWTSIKSLFSGEGFTFEWTPLLEGFKAVTEELPRIAERVKSQTELSLENKLKIVSDRLGQSFDANLRRNAQHLENALDVFRPKAQFQEIAGESESHRRGRKEEFDKKKDGEFKSTIEDLLALSNRIQSAAASKPKTKAESEIVDGLVQNKKAVEKQTEQQKLSHEEQIQALRELKGIGGLI